MSCWTRSRSWSQSLICMSCSSAPLRRFDFVILSVFDAGGEGHSIPREIWVLLLRSQHGEAFKATTDNGTNSVSRSIIIFPKLRSLFFWPSSTIPRKLWAADRFNGKKTPQNGLRCSIGNHPLQCAATKPLLPCKPTPAATDLAPRRYGNGSFAYHVPRVRIDCKPGVFGISTIAIRGKIRKILLTQIRRNTYHCPK